jgi:hypothetical protein
MKTRLICSMGVILFAGMVGAQLVNPNGTTGLWNKMWDAGHSGSSKSKTPKADTSKPKVTITSPASKARLTSAEVTLQGKAKDNRGVSYIQYSVNSGPTTIAWVYSGGAWSAAIHLQPGVNLITAQAVDTSGNRSSIVKRSITYVQGSPLTVTVTGNGSVTPNLNGSTLEVGKNHTLVAKPAAGYRFEGWHGGVSSSLPRLKFTMQVGLVLEARFVPK